MRNYLFAALGLIGLSVVSTAQAVPTLSIRVFDDNSLVAGQSTAVSALDGFTGRDAHRTLRWASCFTG